MIFPNWPYRFQKENFRKNIERWIHENSPAHLYIEVLWLDMKQIEIFEYAFKDLLEAKNEKIIDEENIKSEKIEIKKKLEEIFSTFLEEKIIDEEKIRIASLRLKKILNNFSNSDNKY